MKNTLPLILILLFFISSCIDPEEDITEFEEFFRCQESQNLSKATAELNLIGTWKWEFQICCPESLTPARKDSEALADTKVNFKKDGTGSMQDNYGSAEFIWRIISVDGSFQEIETTPVITILSGKIFFCGDKMLLSNGYRDGADNFYQKKNNED